MSNKILSVTIFIALTCLVAVPVDISAQQQSKSNQRLTAEQRKKNVESFDYIWKTVRDHYWDPKLGGVDWEAQKKRLRPQIEKAQTMEASRTIMRRLLNSMKVSHFGIIPSDAYKKLDSDRPRGQQTTGMNVRIVDGQVLVTEIVKGSSADKQGVKTGWQIIKIGDTDIPKRYREISRELANHRHRRTILVDAVQGRLRGKQGESVDIVFLNGEDKQTQVTIPFDQPKGKPAQFGHIPNFHIWIETSKIKDNVGYIRFNAFMDPASLMPKFNQAMKDFREMDGIIIDVRGNGGGMGEMATAMMGWLLPENKQQMGTVILRDTKLKMIVRPRAEPYRGKVVVLIDEMSISAAEFFASGMKDLKLGHLIGTRTAGAVLGSFIEKLPNGDGFQYARANYISKSTGKTLEGIGVPPHQEIQHRRDALLQGRDLQLESALDWIKKNAK